MRALRHRLGSARLIGLVVAATIAGSTTPAAAAGAGLHRLLDTQGSPAATCVYDSADPGSVLVSIKVRPPLLYAVNRRPGKVDRGTVGWRYVVEGSPAGFLWHQVDEGPIVTAVATDKVKARFAPQTWQAEAVDYNMRVRIDAYWYRNGQVAASLRMTPEWYRYQPFGYAFTGGCGS